MDDIEIEHLRSKLLGSLHEFIDYFFYLRNGRTFNAPDVLGRKSHVSILCEELTKLFRLQTLNLLVNIPPGSGKSVTFTYYIAWAYAHYHDCQNIYISYSSELAETHTAEIKAIMSIPLYRKLFGAYIDPNSSAKGDFRVNHESLPGQGRTCAKGSSGGITGINSGLQDARDGQGLPRYSGGAFMDDLHKPDEVHSDVRRERVIKNYNETIKPRRRGNYVCMALFGQRLHEDDVCQFIMDGRDGQIWKHVELQSLDAAGNAMAPHIISKEQLLIEQKFNEYVFWSQHQQRPVSAAGGIFKKDWFKILRDEPDIIYSFITADTAESEAEWADYTAFAFWGLYKLKVGLTDVPGEYALHRISHRLIKVEPKDLKDEFMDYYTECLRYKCPVSAAAIERKSSGTGLISVLKEIPGVRVINIERNASSGNKTTRFLECQRYVAEGKISLLNDSRNKDEFIDHMGKITANGTHKHDDLADVTADAIKITFIDKLITRQVSASRYDELAINYSIEHNKQQRDARFK